MSIQVKVFDEKSAKEELKSCPKKVRDYVKLLEEALKNQQDLTSKAIGKLRGSKLDFADWICKSGWIIRPFPEESDVYLFDDHSNDDLEELYENPKTLNELYDIFEQTKKQNE